MSIDLYLCLCKKPSEKKRLSVLCRRTLRLIMENNDVDEEIFADAVSTIFSPVLSRKRSNGLKMGMSARNLTNVSCDLEPGSIPNQQPKITDFCSFNRFCSLEDFGCSSDTQPTYASVCSYSSRSERLGFSQTLVDDSRIFALSAKRFF